MADQGDDEEIAAFAIAFYTHIRRRRNTQTKKPEKTAAMQQHNAD